VKQRKYDDQWAKWVAILDGEMDGEHELFHNDWEDYADVNAVIDMVGHLSSEMQKLVALCLSVAKWHPLRGFNRGGCSWTSCGLCNLYYEIGCAGCPLDKIGENCTDDGSCFSRWNVAWRSVDIEKCADEMFDKLMNLYREAYRGYYME